MEGLLESEEDTDVNIPEDQSDRSSEKFNLDVSNTSDESNSDPTLDELLEQRQASTKPAPKAQSKRKQPNHKNLPVASKVNNYDFNVTGKCVLSNHFIHSSHYTSASKSISRDFSIWCSAPRPDGTQAPFNIQSSIRFEDLRDMVAQKMERYPSTLRLQYRLDSDKAKQASMSIQTDDEFKIFIGYLEDLIVPKTLASGRKATRAPKNPLVLFEDSSLTNRGGASHTNNSKTVCNFSIFYFLWSNVYFY